MNIFRDDLPWYRGNLHTHTTNSDGKLTPQDTIAAYRKEGYDFLALTDHWKYHEGYEEEGFTLISGIEYDNNNFETHKAFHVIGLGMTQAPIAERGQLAPDFTAAIKRAGGYSVLGHPWWSLLSPEDMINLPDVFATEIYSGVSEGYSGRGDSSVFVETCAARGCYKMMLGVDDMHFCGRDIFDAWIQLNAPSLSRNDIINALLAGHFYATTGGPQFRQITVEDGFVHVICTPAQAITFYSNAFYSADRMKWGENGETFTQAAYPIGEHDGHVRIQLTGANGKISTSQFIKV